MRRTLAEVTARLVIIGSDNVEISGAILIHFSHPNPVTWWSDQSIFPALQHHAGVRIRGQVILEGPLSNFRNTAILHAHELDRTLRVTYFHRAYAGNKGTGYCERCRQMLVPVRGIFL